MIIDCHYHLEERILTVPDLIGKMDESGIDRVALMGALNDPFPEPPAVGARIMQFLLRRKTLRGMGRLLSGNFNAEGNIRLLSGQTIVIYRDPDNAPVFAAADAHPGRFLGWIFVNPRGAKEQKAEAMKWMGHPACAGIKAHPFWHRYDPVELLPSAQIAAARGKPLILHAGFGSHGDIRALLARVPDLKLVLAHTAFPEFGDTWKEIRANRNVYVDLSQTSYVNRRTIREVVGFLGPERCLYGTDGPFGFHGKDGLFDYTVIKGWIEDIFRDGGVKRRILGENFAELVGIGD
ncbi:MAG TPA: amidohydrolase family protein [Spirochaetota bacterium]|nr:amidohydrolase family protein [Spirochaetota bacterium]HSA14664.1 amidohydrolase family protein [Spirochaetota bacterium]